MPNGSSGIWTWTRGGRQEQLVTLEQYGLVVLLPRHGPSGFLGCKGIRVTVLLCELLIVSLRWGRANLLLGVMSLTMLEKQALTAVLGSHQPAPQHWVPPLCSS